MKKNNVKVAPQKQTKMTKSVLAKAQLLMKEYAQSLKNKEALLATIKNELEAYDENMKEALEDLISIGTKYKHEFDADGNYDLGEGYLHIKNSAVVLTKKKKFNVGVFAEAQPDLINITLKVGEVKKAFQDKALRKELTALGVTIDNEKSIQVLLHKEKVA